MTTGETYPPTPHGRAYIPNIPAQTFAAHADTRLILCPGWRLPRGLSTPLGHAGNGHQ